MYSIIILHLCCWWPWFEQNADLNVYHDVCTCIYVVIVANLLPVVGILHGTNPEQHYAEPESAKCSRWSPLPGMFSYYLTSSLVASVSCLLYFITVEFSQWSPPVQYCYGVTSTSSLHPYLGVQKLIIAKCLLLGLEWYQTRRPMSRQLASSDINTNTYTTV